jgi:ribosomal protein S18 acetylase RimI-like enzyme
MNNQAYVVREAATEEFRDIGALMVHVYGQLAGFFSEEDNPAYYNKLANVGELTAHPMTKLLVAVGPSGQLAGAVVYIGDMKQYGSQGAATHEVDAAGFRLLAVDPVIRGKGIGKLLTNACIQLARDQQRKQVVIHSTNAMKIAWKMYEKIGFERAKELDFSKDDFPIFGFRLKL